MKGKGVNFDKILYIIAASVAIGCVLRVGSAIVAMNNEPKCIKSGCNNNCAPESMFCYFHSIGSKTYYTGGSKSYTGSKSNSHSSGSSKPYSSGSGKSSYDDYHDAVSSYDSGYDDVYYDDWYDEDRYYSDPDYADGVDAAMDELGW